MNDKEDVCPKCGSTYIETDYRFEDGDIEVKDAWCTECEFEFQMVHEVEYRSFYLRTEWENIDEVDTNKLTNERW